MKNCFINSINFEHEFINNDIYEDYPFKSVIKLKYSVVVKKNNIWIIEPNKYRFPIKENSYKTGVFNIDKELEYKHLIEPILKCFIETKVKEFVTDFKAIYFDRSELKGLGAINRKWKLKINKGGLK